MPFMKDSKTNLSATGNFFFVEITYYYPCLGPNALYEGLQKTNVSATGNFFR